MRNSETSRDKLKKAFCYQKLSWPFTVWINCSSNIKIFANSQPSASNFKSFSRSLEHFFLTVGQNNFGNKIPFLHLKNPIKKCERFSLAMHHKSDQFSHKISCRNWIWPKHLPYITVFCHSFLQLLLPAKVIVYKSCSEIRLKEFTVCWGYMLPPKKDG